MIISVVGSRDTGKSHFVGVIINELIERISVKFGGAMEGFDDTMQRYKAGAYQKLYMDMQKLDLTQSSVHQLDENTVSRASSVDWKQATRSDDIMARVSKLIRNDRRMKSEQKIDIPVAAVFSKFDAIASLIPEGSTVLENSPHCDEGRFDMADWHNVDSEIRSLLTEWGAESFPG